MSKQFYHISFPKFTSLFCFDLTAKEIDTIKSIKSTMSFDEYAGYSPEEQGKYEQIQNLISNRTFKINSI
jgi:hypothetical protein